MQCAMWTTEYPLTKKKKKKKKKKNKKNRRFEFSSTDTVFAQICELATTGMQGVICYQQHAGVKRGAINPPPPSPSHLVPGRTSV